MVNKIKKITILFIFLAIVLPIFSCTAYSPVVQLYANGSSTSPVSISYNSSLNLTWSSNDVDYCQASGDWSGTKAISGLETINNVTSNKSFTITCYGTSGYATSKIDITLTNIPTSLRVNKLVRNVSDGNAYQDSVLADPDERLSFQINITAGNTSLQDVIVKDTLPSKIIYLGNLKVDNLSSSGNITLGFDIGDFSANQTKIVTFDAVVADSNQFLIGTTNLINSVLVYNSLLANSDTAKVVISKTTGTGPTNVPTGISNNILLDSFLIPLAISFLMIWTFKSHIINFEEWLDNKKRGYNGYKAKKTLHSRISQIKSEEFSRKK
jgi:hypothetical protein